jgi:hypothetical protein
MMEEIDFGNWAKRSENSANAVFRQAVHTLMLAISKSDALQTRMIFHGGLLLAIRFQGIRHTKDIDFVTAEKRTQIDEDHFIASLNQGLAIACENLSYGLDCRIQSYRVKPPGENRNFQSLKIGMGYAYKGTPGHRRLMKGVDGGKILAYSLPDLVGEKYRAMIQQKSRNRMRRQDAFDIYSLLKSGYLEDRTLKIRIYRSLLIKALSRQLAVNKDSLADEEIIGRSKAEYATLADEIDGELPPFEEVYNAVRNYYESLPWGKD